MLREGNSDRRAAIAVKNYAKANPHSMGKWAADSKTYVSTMSSGDFRSNEKSATLTAAQAGAARIELVKAGWYRHRAERRRELSPPAQSSMRPSCRPRRSSAFLTEQIDGAKRNGVLFSIHLKATMMKVSDPIIFGHAVKAFLKPVFDKHGAALDSGRGRIPNSGLGALLDQVADDAGARRRSKPTSRP